MYLFLEPSLDAHATLEEKIHLLFISFFLFDNNRTTELTIYTHWLHIHFTTRTYFHFFSCLFTASMYFSLYSFTHPITVLFFFIYSPCKNHFLVVWDCHSRNKYPQGWGERTFSLFGGSLPPSALPTLQNTYVCLFHSR